MSACNYCRGVINHFHCKFGRCQTNENERYSMGNSHECISYISHLSLLSLSLFFFSASGSVCPFIFKLFCFSFFHAYPFHNWVRNIDSRGEISNWYYFQLFFPPMKIMFRFLIIIVKKVKL